MRCSPVLSAFACFLVLGGAATAQGTKRVSLSSNGVQGDSGSFAPALSARGRYVVFDGEASNLVPGDTNDADDVFLRDVRLGTTVRVSVSSAGAQGDGDSYSPAIDAIGRYVAFYSEASNLVPGDTNGMEDVFVHDAWTGTTTRVSVDSSGAQGNGRSYYPALSGSGRHVVFYSFASNLVPSDTNRAGDVFLHDRVLGTTTRVSVDSTGVPGNGDSTYPSISFDGTKVAFESGASNLAPGDMNGSVDVFVRDLTTGITVCASVDPSGVPGEGGCVYSGISGDGRAVAFGSWSSDLVAGDLNDRTDVFVRDLVAGITERVSVGPGGAEGHGISQVLTPAPLSYDGRFVAFKSTADDLVTGDTNRAQDVFLHDRSLGRTVRMNVDSQGAEALGWSSQPTISADGRFVGYYSFAPNLVPGDTNGEPDVFLRRIR